MSSIRPDQPGLPSFQAVHRFLRLLDDINRMQDELLQETERLRARVRELEAGAGGSGTGEEPKT